MEALGISQQSRQGSNLKMLTAPGEGGVGGTIGGGGGACFCISLRMSSHAVPPSLWMLSTRDWNSTAHTISHQ